MSRNNDVAFEEVIADSCESFLVDSNMIENIQELKTAILYAKDSNVTHNKFDYFCYYRVLVKYKNETYPVYLNIGRAKNDNSYQLYDITKNIKDTANRMNGLERPKTSKGYALQSGISIVSIPHIIDNGNTNFKKSERDAVYKLENYDYNLHENQTDATKLILKLQKGGYNEKQPRTILQNYTSVYGTIFKRYNSKSRRFVKFTQESASIRENNRKESARTRSLGVIGEEFSDSGVKLYQARPEC